MSSPTSLQQNTSNLDLEEQEQEAAALHELAESIVLECKQSRSVAALETAIFLLYQVVAQRPPGNPFRNTSLRHLAMALLARFIHIGYVEDLDEVLMLIHEVITGQRHPAILDRNPTMVQDAITVDHDEQLSMTEIALGALSEFWQSAQLSSIESAVHLYREAIILRPPPNPKQSITLFGLAEVLIIRFYHKDMLQDLDEVILLLQDILHLQPSPDPIRFQSLLFLCFHSCLRFTQTADPQLMLGALQLHIKAYNEDADARNSFDHGTAMLKVFQQSGQASDLREAVSLLYASLWQRPYPNPNRSNSLSNLATALVIQYEQTGQLHDLEESISFHQEALKLRPPSHPDRSSSLNNLANAFTLQFEHAGQLHDLEESISLHQKALDLLPLSHPDQASSLNNLATALMTQFQHLGQLSDLQKSISFLWKALDLIPPFHPDRPSLLNNLANGLVVQFEQMGQLGDLEKSIALYQEALGLTPPSHPNQSNSLNNLANGLIRRFQQLGQLSDLEKSIFFHRKALNLRPPPHPYRSTTLTNLANTLMMQFQQRDQLCDLVESIALYRKALDLAPPAHFNQYGYLNNLANGLMRQFELMGQLCDLKESISFYREALNLSAPSNSDQSSLLNNLAIGLMTQFQKMGQHCDLQESISLHEKALALRPTSHPKRFCSLNNLANAFMTQFEQTGQLHDLEQSIFYYKDCISLLPTNHPNKYLSESLGNALVKLYGATGQYQYFSEAMTTFQDAVTSVSSSILHRFNAAKNWAQHADSQHHPSALNAYQHAINLLPHLATLGMNLKTRLDALSKANGLACNAAHCAIKAGNLEKAVEFLSEGRAIFWTQALQLHSSFNELQTIAPALAQKLQTISDALERGSHRDSRDMNDTFQKVETLEQEASHYRILNDEWNDTLDEVRKLDGFQEFLCTKSFHALRKVADHGPVVLLNASQSGCDGLILTPNGGIHVPFPHLTISTLKDLGTMIKIALSSSGIHLHLPDSAGMILETLVQKQQNYPERAGRVACPIPSLHSEDLFQCVLGKLWFDVVHPVIQALRLQKSASPTHIWWCPTGPFAFLPLHAAGIYDTGGMGLESASDYMISSYTPTLDTLLTPTPPTTNDFKVVTIIQPDIPGKPHLSLPCTRKELQKIEQKVPSQYLVRLGTAQEPTSIEKVLSNLSSASIAHFACHGVQNSQNPLDSALLLGDGDLKISKIMQLSMPSASLAFLSACQTAAGDREIPDEAMHIAATMLFAGFRGVVGTMWSIYDDDAPVIAEVFYGELFKDGLEKRPDTTQAAGALHLAVKKLRANKAVSFRRWVPFIHLGI